MTDLKERIRDALGGTCLTTPRFEALVALCEEIRREAEEQSGGQPPHPQPEFGIDPSLLSVPRENVTATEVRELVRALYGREADRLASEGSVRGETPRSASSSPSVPAPGYWTAEPPEEEGWYWISDSEGGVEPKWLGRGRARALREVWWCGPNNWTQATQEWDWSRFTERIVEPPSPEECARVAGETEGVEK